MRITELHHPPNVLIDLLRRDCSEYLDILCATKKPLFRGVQKFHHSYYINIAPRNRRVHIGDDHWWIEVCTDRYLKKQNFTALRTKSTFCTTNGAAAGQYGDIFMVFPKNGFSFAYGSQPDLHLDVSAWLRYDASCYALDYGYSNVMSSYLDDTYGDLCIFSVYLKRSRIMRSLFEKLYLAMYEFRQDNLGVAMQRGVEVWFSGNYHMVRLDSPEGLAVREALGLE